MSHDTVPMNEGAASGEHIGVRFGRLLTDGIRHLGPFVAVGGLLLALAYLISGWKISMNAAQLMEQSFAWTSADSWATLMIRSGSTALAFVVPALTVYVAYGVAGRAALVPGAVGGLLAMNLDSGFLGGLATGLLVGASVLGLRRLALPQRTVTEPLIASLVASVVLYGLVRDWLADLQIGVNGLLTRLTEGHGALLGLVLGVFVCCDLGGPVSKATFSFAAGGLSVATPYNLSVVAAVVAAGAVPALGMSLATIVRGRVFAPAERSYGKVAWLLGLAGVSEGAIPFAAADPLRVLPAAMAGGAVTGSLAMTFTTTQKALYGGVFAAGEIGEPLLYGLALAAGIVVTAGTAILLKSLGKESVTRPAAVGKLAVVR
ncbi:fructose-specific PTS transporter subunit EIIC [Streptomyces sp. SID13726]|uniref:fructose-specific PTS transporter subunit EIIC n=1 Tax=Streptomyces sp. SID13726 TaxID=2706058 RepID=UPI0013B7D9CF|nr:fructose-specific PTS transporter subunit EIIC [Streptomyces sp. SID13726]NEA99035.1 hypothetical protein [Streptomyces sp. SID13726]